MFKAEDSRPVSRPDAKANAPRGLERQREWLWLWEVDFPGKGGVLISSPEGRTYRQVSTNKSRFLKESNFLAPSVDNDLAIEDHIFPTGSIFLAFLSH